MAKKISEVKLPITIKVRGKVYRYHKGTQFKKDAETIADNLKRKGWQTHIIPAEVRDTILINGKVVRRKRAVYYAVYRR